jgi:AcrR family transcriptional regulator
VSARRPSSLSWGTVPAARRRRGRSSDPARDAAIQAATLELLSEVGYAGLTMDAVAAAARVSKATIYRRWRTKADLLVSVIDSANEDSLAVPDTGSLRGDLVGLLTSLARVLGGPGGRASRALLGAINDEPALAAAFHGGPQERWAQAFRQVFVHAVARGEIEPAAGTSLAAEAGPAILLQRWMISGQQIDQQLAEAVVDTVMMPLMLPGHGVSGTRDPTHRPGG